MTKTIKHFLRGAGHLFDFAGVQPHQAMQDARIKITARVIFSDAEAMTSDFQQVGDDMRTAMRELPIPPKHVR